MRVNGEKIRGEFSLSVKPGSQEAENEDLRKQQDLKFAEMMAQNPHVDQRKLAERLSKRFDIEPEEILLPPEQAQANMAAAAESGKKPEKPPLNFSPIKVELLPPQIQAMVISAAMKMNGAADIAGPQGEGADLPPGIGNPASPSMAGSAPLENSVMPGAEINQAPSLREGQNMPPPTPVGPMSEMQGGFV